MDPIFKFPVLKMKAPFIFVLLLFFLRSAEAAFIQSPIPPSSLKNYFKDTHNDSRMDQVTISFLGTLSAEDLLHLDSLTVSWIDSLGNPITFKASSQEIQIDPTSTKTILYNIPSPVNTLKGLTSLNSPQISIPYGKVFLYLSGQEPIEIQMRESIPPAILSASLSISQETHLDTLLIFFSENTTETSSVPCLLEFKPFGESNLLELCHTSIEWASDYTYARFILHRNLSSAIKPQDSLRMLPGAFKDSLKNTIGFLSPFVFVSGTSPFFIHTVSKGEFTANNAQKSLPVFQFFSASIDSEIPNLSEMGVAFTLQGLSLEKIIRNQIIPFNKSDSFTAIDPEKIRIKMGFQVFTNLGTHVAKTHYELNCADKRFSKSPQNIKTCLEDTQKLFLRWNFMSDQKRLVATGIYIIKYSISISYEGQIIFYHESHPQIWGVQRR